MGTSDESKRARENEKHRPAPKRRRKWLRGLIIVLALLVVLIAAAPYIASTRVVVDWGLGMANDTIRGTVGVESVSLSWFGPCRVAGIRLADPNGREVVSVREVATSSGLWALATAWSDLGRIDVQGPRVVLYRRADGQFSLMEAVRLREPAEEEAEPSEPPELHGRIIVTGGSVRLVEADGREYDVPDFGGDVTLATLDRIEGKAAVTPAGGGTIHVKISLQDLLAAGAGQGKKLGAAVSVTTDGAVDLEPVGRFAAPDSGLKGKVAVKLSADVDGKGTRGTASVNVTGLAAAVTAGRPGEPVKLTLGGTFASNAKEEMSGEARLGGDCGTAQCTFSYAAGAGAAPTVEQVIAAVLSGEKLSLPAARLDANGQLDLARLFRAVPALAHIRKDVQVTGGTLAVRDIAVRGGDQPFARGGLTLTGLTARRGEADIQWQPISLTFDAALVPDQGLHLRDASVRSEFATLDANGTPKDLKASSVVQLAALHARLGEVFELGDLEFAGSAGVSLAVSVRDANTAAFGYEAKAAGLRFAQGGSAVASSSASMSGTGAIRGVRDHPAVTTSGQMTLAGLVMDGNALSDRPIAAKWTDVTYAASAKELAVAAADVTGGPVTASIQSLAASFGEKLRLAGTVTVGADLARCMDLAARLGDGNRPADVTGTLAWSGKAAQDAKEISLTGSGSLTGLVVGTGKRAARLAPIELRQSARIDTAAETVRLETFHVGGDALTVTAAGTVAGFRTDPNAAVAVTYGGDVGKLAAIAQALSAPPKDPNAPAPPTLAGTLSGTADVHRTPGEGVLATSGDLKIDGLAIDGNALGDRPITAKWNGVRFTARTGELRVPLATLTGDPAAAEVKGLVARLGEQLRLDGTVDVSADLARVAAVAAALGGKAQPMDLAGALSWSGKATGANGTISVTGGGDVKDFVVGPKGKSVRIDPMTFAQSVQIDPNKETIRIASFDANSNVLSLTAKGTVERYRTEQNLNITGHYTGKWADLTTLLHALSPNSTDIVLTGKLDSVFTLTGPASKPKLTPAYREMGANAGVGWASAKAMGFELGQADLPFALADGRVVLPKRSIPASGGQINLDGNVDLRGEAPVLNIPPRTALLDNVAINKKIAQELLSRFNPIFGQLVEIDGNVTLVTEGLALPLGEAIKTQGAGKGRLDLSAMNVRPGGLMAALLKLGGLSPDETHRLEVSPVDFRIEKGAIHYDNFTLTFDKTFPLVFSGAARFDDGLDLRVGVPVRAALLQRLGVRGPVAEYAKYLENARIAVPLVGTRTEPRLDLSSVDPKPLVEKAAEGLLKDKGKGILENLLDREKGGKDGKDKPGLSLPGLLGGGKQAPSTRPGPKDPNQPKKPEDRLIEGLFDALGGDKKNK